MTDVRNAPRDPEDIELPDGLDLPDVIDESEDDDARSDDDEELDDFSDEEANDDRLADDLPIGDVEVEEESANDHGDGPLSIDLGDHDGFEDEARSEETDESPIAVDDADGLEVSEEHEADDGGAEGTSEDISAGVDESALPALDADEGGAFDLHDLMNELAAAGLEGDSVPWVVRDDWANGEVLADVTAEPGASSRSAAISSCSMRELVERVVCVSRKARRASHSPKPPSSSVLAER